MEILSKDSFPPLGYDNTIRISLLHQSIIRDIRIRAHKINFENSTIEELKEFVSYVMDKTE